VDYNKVLLWCDEGGCNAYSRNRNTLLNHKRKAHKIVGSFVCGICRSAHESMKGLRLHDP
jgi:hypothetical protein